MKDENQIVTDYRNDGVVRIRQFFSQELVDEIRFELERYMREDLPDCPKDARTLEADGQTIRNLWRLHKYNSFFRELALRPDMLSLVAKLVNGEPFLMGVETFSKPARIGSGVPPHQDNAYFCQEPPDVLTIWVAIDPVTKENGAVHFIKGSHKQGMLPTKPSGVTGNSIGLANPPNVPLSEQFCATLSPGDATIHHCETLHQSEPNLTDLSRLGLLLVYRGSHTQTNPALKEAYSKAVTATPPA